MLRVRRFGGRKGRTRKNNEDFEAWRLYAVTCSFSTMKCRPHTCLRRFRSFKILGVKIVHLQESAICTTNGYKKTNGGVRRKLDTPLVIKGRRGQHRDLLGYVLSCPHIRRGDVSLLLRTRKRKLVPGADAKRNSSPSSTTVVGALRLPTIFLWRGKTRCAFDCNT